MITIPQPGPPSLQAPIPPAYSRGPGARAADCGSGYLDGGIHNSRGRAWVGGMDPAGVGGGGVEPGRAGCTQQGAGELALLDFLHPAGGGC